jgi:hypothetical protein
VTPEEAARAMGVAGTLEARRGRHASERDRFRALIEAVSAARSERAAEVDRALERTFEEVHGGG